MSINFCPFNDGFQETGNLMEYLKQSYDAFWQLENDRTTDIMLTVMIPELSKVLIFMEGMETYLVSGYVDISTSQFMVERCFAMTVDHSRINSMEEYVCQHGGQFLPNALLQQMPPDIVFDERVKSSVQWETPDEIMQHLRAVLTVHKGKF